MAETLKFPYHGFYRGKAFIAALPPYCKTLTTSVTGGGLRRDVTHLFNFDLKNAQGVCELTEDTYEKELIAIAKSLKLPVATTVGMTTAVSMTELAETTCCDHGLSVTAVTTAGIENNGGCAGDPCGYREENDGFLPHHGTINTMVFINADLPDGILFRAAVTATEGKTAAIRSLELPSNYSRELATGSGTDGLFLIANTASPLKRTDAGKHALLGELIGRAVGDSVTEALLKHEKAADAHLTLMEKRLKRFGLDENRFILFLKERDNESQGAAIWNRAKNNEEATIKAGLVTALLEEDHRHRISEETLRRELQNILDITLQKESPWNTLFYLWLFRNFGKK